MPKIPETVEEAIVTFATELKKNLMARVIVEGEPADEIIAQNHYFGLMQLRNAWGMGKTESLLVKDFRAKYGLIHPDDLSGIIAKGGLALYRGEDVADTIAKEAARYKKHWIDHGLDPATMTPLKKIGE